jgi:hypothetical protein
MKKSTKTLLVPLVLIGGLISSPMPSFAALSRTLVIPVTKNPIVNKSKKVGFTILSAQVQDNTDLKAISTFAIYYTMIDQVTKASESYYQKLVPFLIPAKSIGYIAFDNTKGLGHFPENTYSIYRNSKNEVKFIIELSATGFKPQLTKVLKAKGTTENPNG